MFLAINYFRKTLHLKMFDRVLNQPLTEMACFRSAWNKFNTELSFKEFKDVNYEKGCNSNIFFMTNLVASWWDNWISHHFLFFSFSFIYVLDFWFWSCRQDEQTFITFIWIHVLDFFGFRLVLDLSLHKICNNTVFHYPHSPV